MTTPTKNYGLTKPDVGGSENEWGGLLNGDLDEIDALLGGDSPINGINIESGTIDGSTIEGTIDNVVLGPDNEISGKVGTLTGDDSSTISGCDITAKKLGVRDEMLKRSLNTGFSGGEKKRMEILQMALLEPSLCVLDETDSGLDIDALKVVANGVNALRGPDRGFLVITHYQRLLDYIVPDYVHVLSDGRIVKTGDKGLALELEAKGYADIIADAA